MYSTIPVVTERDVLTKSEVKTVAMDLTVVAWTPHMFETVTNMLLETADMGT